MREARSLALGETQAQSRAWLGTRAGSGRPGASPRSAWCRRAAGAARAGSGCDVRCRWDSCATPWKDWVRAAAGAPFRASNWVAIVLTVFFCPQRTQRTQRRAERYDGLGECHAVQSTIRNLCFLCVLCVLCGQVPFFQLLAKCLVRGLSNQFGVARTSRCNGARRRGQKLPCADRVAAALRALSRSG